MGSKWVSRIKGKLGEILRDFRKLVYVYYRKDNQIYMIWERLQILSLIYRVLSSESLRSSLLTWVGKNEYPVRWRLNWIIEDLDKSRFLN